MYQLLDTESSSESVDSIFENISIPYSRKLGQNLRIGSSIRIMGKINRNANRFAINLMTDETSCNDVAFHFNPRFTDGFVVRNSRINNKWSNEERDYYIPFERNQDFNIIINVSKEVYQTLINGIHFIDFGHRLPFSRVNTIAIDGDVEIACIEMSNSNNGSLSSLSCTEPKPIQIDPIFDPVVPFSHDIPYGLRNGMVFGIIGRPLTNARKFDINLINRRSLKKNVDIALHISVRFGKQFTDSVVVRNSRFSGEWGDEDKYSSEFPFILEKIFDIRIIVESYRFIIIINGKHFAEFYNRIYPMSDTNQIEIYGDLILLSIRICTARQYEACTLSRLRFPPLYNTGSNVSIRTVQHSSGKKVMIQTFPSV